MSGFPGGQRRLLFTGNTNTNLVNKYTNAGIGGTSSAVRRAKLRRAMSNPGTFDSATGVYNFDGQPCCSPELFRKNKGYYGNDLIIEKGGDTPTPDPPVNPDNPLNPDTGEPQTNVEGFQIWYDGADKDYYQPRSIASDPTTNKDITQWNDKSGQAHNAGPPGGTNRRPQYSYDPSLNGLSYVRFDIIDGVNDDCLEVDLTGAGDWLANQQNLVVFMVAGPRVTATGPHTLFNTEQDDIDFHIQSDEYRFSFYNGTTALDVSGAASANPFLATLRYRGGEATDADKFQFRLNTGSSGEMQNQTLQFTGTGVPSSISSDPDRIGLGCINNGRFYDGYIAEILIYTVNLELSGIQAVENYLNNKWFNV